MFFLLLFLYYCPLSPVCTSSFAGVHVGIFNGVHAVEYLCLNGLLCGQKLCNTSNYSGNTYLCMSKLKYEQT